MLSVRYCVLCLRGKRFFKEFRFEGVGGFGVEFLFVIYEILGKLGEF